MTAKKKKPAQPKIARAQLAEAVRYYNIHFPKNFLLGLPPPIREPEVRKKKAFVAFKKGQPKQFESQAKAFAAQAKVEIKNAKIDFTIKVNNAIEAERGNGPPAQVEAANELISQRQQGQGAQQGALDTAQVEAVNELISQRQQEQAAAQGDLDAALEDLVAQNNLVSSLRETMQAAAVELRIALATWDGTDASDAAQVVREAIEDLLLAVTGLAVQAAGAPGASGDALAVHLDVLGVWRVQVVEAVADFGAAVADWGGGVAGLGLALVEAGELTLAAVAALAVQLEEYEGAAAVAQAHQIRVDTAREELQGAQDALAGLNGPAGNAWGAVNKATSERLAQQTSAAAAFAAAAAIDVQQTVLLQRAAGG